MKEVKELRVRVVVGGVDAHGILDAKKIVRRKNEAFEGAKGKRAVLLLLVLFLLVGMSHRY